MNVRESRKQVRESMKKLPPKERIFAYLNYYGPLLIAAAVILLLGSWFFSDILEQILHPLEYRVLIIGSTDTDKTPSFEADIAALLRKDARRISVDDSLSLNEEADPQFVFSSIEKMYLEATAGDLDMIIVGRQYAEALAKGGIAADLSSCSLPGELLYLTDDSGEKIAAALVPEDSTLTKHYGFPEDAVVIFAVNSRHMNSNIQLSDHLFR